MEMAGKIDKAPLASLDEYLYTELTTEDAIELPESRCNITEPEGSTEGLIDDHSSYTSNNDDIIELAISGRRVFLRRHRVVSCCLKYSLFVFNYIFWIVGIVIVVGGSWILNERNKLGRNVADFILDPIIVILVFGLLIVIITFIGCVGSIRENILLLKLFHYSVSVVLFVELVLFVVAVVFYQTPKLRKYLEAIPEDIIKNAIKGYHDDEHLKDWMDLLQTELKCCGYSLDDDGYKDWTLNMYHNCTETSETNKSPLRCTVPMSCCIIKKGDYINQMCGFGVINLHRSEIMNRIQTTGCMKAVNQWIRSHNPILLISVFGIAVSQIISVVLARVLVHSIVKQISRWRLLNEDQ